MKSPAVILALLCLSCASGAIHAQERGAIPEYQEFGLEGAETARDALFAWQAEYVRAWADEDGAALAELHAEDTEWTNAFARIIRGSGVLADFLDERMFPGFEPQISQAEAAAIKPISTRLLGGDAAVLHFYADSFRGVSPGDRPRRVHFHIVLQRQQGEWRAVHTAIMDARR